MHKAKVINGMKKYCIIKPKKYHHDSSKIKIKGKEN